MVAGDGVGDDLRALLRNGKYTHWMSKLSDRKLAGLLWLVGEFSIRSSDGDYDVNDHDYPGERRKYGALAAIVSFRRSPMSLDEVKRYIRSCLRGGFSGKTAQEMEKHLERKRIARAQSKATPWSMIRL